MGIRRIGKHLLAAPLAGAAHFPPNVLAAIEQAIKAGEATHSGQVRFVVEGALDGAPLFRNQPARERALDIFSQLRIWDTAHNNGVLIYLLLADRNVEIIADRGIDAKVGAAGWEKICAEMETDFRARNFERGVIKGIEAVSRELAKHFPPHARRPQRTARRAGGDLGHALLVASSFETPGSQHGSSGRGVNLRIGSKPSWRASRTMRTGCSGACASSCRPAC